MHTRESLRFADKQKREVSRSGEGQRKTQHQRDSQPYSYSQSTMGSGNVDANHPAPTNKRTEKGRNTCLRRPGFTSFPKQVRSLPAASPITGTNVTIPVCTRSVERASCQCITAARLGKGRGTYQNKPGRIRRNQTWFLDWSVVCYLQVVCYARTPWGESEREIWRKVEGTARRRVGQSNTFLSAVRENTCAKEEQERRKGKAVDGWGNYEHDERTFFFRQS